MTAELDGDDGNGKLTQIDLDLGDGTFSTFSFDSVGLPPLAPNGIIKKGTGVLHSYPLDGKELTILDRKVMNAIILHTQRVFAAMTPQEQNNIRDPDIKGTKIFHIRITPLAEYTTAPGQSSPNLNRLYESLDHLFEWHFRFSVTSDKFSSTESKASFYASRGRFFSDLAYGPDDGLPPGHIAYVIPNSTLLMIIEPKIFALFSMHVANAMRSSAVHALYENCTRYLNTEKRTTALLPVQEWINIISGEGKYQDQYPKWKDKVLKPIFATLKANDQVPFTVSVIERKSVRNKVVAIQFQMEMKSQKGLNFELPVTWHPSNLEVLRNQYGFTDKQIIELSAGATEPEVVESMRRASLMIAKKTSQGEPVANKRSYLLGILRNVQKGLSENTPPEPDPESIKQIRLNEAKQLMQAQQDKFKEFQYQVIATKLEMLDASEIQLIRDEFLQQSAAQIPPAAISKGWGPANKLLHGTFKSWIYKTPAYRDRFLSEAEEIDFLTWKTLQDIGDKARSE